MTDRTPRVDNSRDRSKWIAFKNMSGEAIPAYAIMKLTAWDNATLSFAYYDAEKPDGGDGLYFANGPIEVANNAYGTTFLWQVPRQVKLDSAAALGDEVGPSDGSWEMSSSGSGFQVFREASSGVGVVQKIGGGGGGGTRIIRFLITSADPVNRTALCNIESGPVDGIVPDAFLNNSQVTVCDPSGCFFNEPVGDLIGRYGFAAYLKGRDNDACDPDAYTIDSHWEVFSLCCPTSECES